MLRQNNTQTSIWSTDLTHTRVITAWILKYYLQPFKHQPHKIVKHTQTICRQQPTNCLNVFYHYVNLKFLNFLAIKIFCNTKKNMKNGPNLGDRRVVEIINVQRQFIHYINVLQHFLIICRANFVCCLFFSRSYVLPVCTDI